MPNDPAFDPTDYDAEFLAAEGGVGDLVEPAEVPADPFDGAF